jgi:hypothetical protein
MAEAVGMRGGTITLPIFALREKQALFLSISPARQNQPAESTQAPSEVLQQFQRFGPGAVAIAGLIDGVNPCAFTSIVFFLSMLAYLKKARRQIMIIGVGFTTGSFIGYFLLGLGLMGAVKSFSVNHGLSCGIAYGVVVMAFALAAWSIVDAVRYARTGDTKQVTLGLPKQLKDRVHSVIRNGLKTRNLALGSFLVGLAVSVLESLCTGQIYLPVIMFITRAPGLRARAVAYLLLHNVMFILPLVVILTMAYCGVRSEKLGQFLRRHLAVAKLGMAVLFVALGVLILATL